MNYGGPLLAEKQDCTGCGACAAICPADCLTMKQDRYGFPYPQPDHSKCLRCDRCTQVCPVLHPPSLHTELLKSFAACADNDDLRRNSSSGGIFSALAEIILSRKGLVCGAAYDASFRVRHCIIDRREDLEKLRGAKYSQSDIKDCYQQIRAALKKGQEVLFTGTPCQAAGLKKFLGREEPGLVIIDFVCHGVPAPGAWQAYLCYRSREDAEGMAPTAINQRSKSTGWSHYRYSCLYRYGDRKHIILNSEDPYMKIFIGNAILRDSCAHCRFKGGERCSDLTLGDFWGIWDLDPEMDDDKGTSLVLLHSRKGRKLFTEAAGSLHSKETDFMRAAAANPSLIASSIPHAEREKILNLFCRGRIEQAVKIYEGSERRLLKSIAARLRGR